MLNRTKCANLSKIKIKANCIQFFDYFDLFIEFLFLYLLKFSNLEEPIMRSIIP